MAKTTRNSADILIKLASLSKKASEEIEIPTSDPRAVDTAPAEAPEQASNDDGASDTPVGQPSEFLSDSIKTMLDQQIGNELSAFYEYTAAKAWFTGLGLDGFATWLAAQANDESEHMNKVLDYVTEAGVTASLPGISAPTTSFASPTAVVEAIMQREKSVTANWRAIGKQALAEGDVATMDLAQWFVREQMEEEDSVKAIHTKLSAAGGDGPGLLVIDSQLMGKYK